MADPVPAPPANAPLPAPVPPAGKGIPRRRLLLYLGLGGAGAAVAASGYRLFSWGTPAAGLHTLTPVELTIARAVAEVLFPGEPGIPSAAEVDAVTAFDALLAESDALTARLMKLILRAIGWSTFPRSFAKLPLDVRRAALLRWERSPSSLRRGALTALKVFMGMPYFEDERVRKGMGWRLGCEN